MLQIMLACSRECTRVIGLKLPKIALCIVIRMLCALYKPMGMCLFFRLGELQSVVE